MDWITVIWTCLVVYAVVALIVWAATDDLAKGLLWVFYIIGDVLEVLADCDLDLD
jgi:uncharacterized membrane protein YeiB